MSVSIMCGELRSGRRLTEVPVSGASWDVKHNAAGTVEATIQLGDAGVRARRELVASLDPARCFLAAVTEDDQVLEAGPIWSHSYDAHKQALTVRAGGIETLFAYRKLIQVLLPGDVPQEQTYTYTSSLGTIAKRLIQMAMSHFGGSLPIVLPADETGTNTRTYYGYELAWVADRLKQLREVMSGPDIAFEPRMTADRLGIEWVMRHGSTSDPLLHQDGDDWVWDARVAKSAVSGLSVNRDGAGMAMRSWATGSGQETALLMAMEEDLSRLDDGYPLLEQESAHSSVSTLSVLGAHAQAGLEAAARPWQTWNFDVRPDADPRLGTYRPGDWAKVWVPEDHLYLRSLLGEGFYRTRILGFSGGLTGSVKHVHAPIMEARV